MSDWAHWSSAYEKLTLRVDGDPVEKRASTQFDIETHFPNYAVFWRRHVAPATNRPANIDIRKEVSPQISAIATTNHSLLDDLINAAGLLVKINQGDLGSDRFRNCVDVFQSAGNAVQKFTDLQQKLEATLTQVQGSKVAIWTKADWKSRWEPTREAVVGYRNFFTHEGHPYVMMVPQTQGSPIPYALHQNHVQKPYLTWPEQEAMYKTNPERWSPLVTICNNLHRDAISWLNDAYAEVIRTADQFLTNEDYQCLWGWDTNKHGRHSSRQSGPIPAYGHVFGT